MEDETEPKNVKESLIAGVMAATLDNSEHASAWMTRDELRQLRRILAFAGITAARVHKAPRKKLEKRPLDKKGVSLRRSRLSILIGEDAEDVFVMDETPHEAMISGSEKMPFAKLCGKA